MTGNQNDKEECINKGISFKSFFEQSPLSYQSLDSTGRYLDVNPAWERTFGYSREEVLGQKFTDFMTEDSGEKVAQKFPTLKEYGEVKDAIFEMIHKDGHAILVTLHGRATYDENGDFLNTNCILIDITERTRFQEKLARSEERFRQIVDSSELFIWEVDSNGLYTYCSDTCEKIFGLPASQIVGKKHFYDFFPSGNMREQKRLAFEIFERRGVFKDFSNQNVNANGEIVWLQTNGAPVFSLDGNFCGYRGADINVTDRIRFFEEQKRTAQWVAVGRLAANTAHEINNPIQAIVSFAEIIKDASNDSSMCSEMAGRIIEEGMKVGSIIKSTLHYSKPKGRGRNNEKLKELVDSTLPLVQGRMEKEGVSMRLDIAEDLPPIMVNRQEIERCIVNLLTNAMDALIDKKIAAMSGLIEISATEDLEQNEISLVVVDNGCGIDEGVIDTVREAFYTTKSIDRGTGLGLSIVDDIMKNHGGSLVIESEIGQYTKVSLNFPLANV